MFNFQVLSDLHLEYLDSTEYDLILTPSDDVDMLIMSGDISTYDCPELPNFLAWISARYKQIIWVLGNHEYYNIIGKSMSEIKQILRSICPQNIRILDCEYLELDNVIIIGATLWSWIPTEHECFIKRSISDFRRIYIAPYNNITPAQVNEMHIHDRDYIINTLETLGTVGSKILVYPNTTTTNIHKPIIIVTHHAPRVKNTSPDEYISGYLNHAFATDIILSDTAKQANIQYWIYGHTHHNNREYITIGANRGYWLLSNQFGYEGEHTGLGYQYNQHIQITE